MEEPKLVKVWVGWAAVGDGWAVYAPTMQEAINRFRAAARYYGDTRQREVSEDIMAEGVADDMPLAE
jgi:hypothetical protein